MTIERREKAELNAIRVCWSKPFAKVNRESFADVHLALLFEDVHLVINNLDWNLVMVSKTPCNWGALTCALYYL